MSFAKTRSLMVYYPRAGRERLPRCTRPVVGGLGAIPSPRRLAVITAATTELVGNLVTVRAAGGQGEPSTGQDLQGLHGHVSSTGLEGNDIEGAVVHRGRLRLAPAPA